MGGFYETGLLTTEVITVSQNPTIKTLDPMGGTGRDYPGYSTSGGPFVNEAIAPAGGSNRIDLYSATTEQHLPSSGALLTFSTSHNAVRTANVGGHAITIIAGGNWRPVHFYNHTSGLLINSTAADGLSVNRSAPCSAVVGELVYIIGGSVTSATADVFNMRTLYPPPPPPPISWLVPGNVFGLSKWPWRGGTVRRPLWVRTSMSGAVLTARTSMRRWR